MVSQGAQEEHGMLSVSEAHEMNTTTYMLNWDPNQCPAVLPVKILWGPAVVSAQLQREEAGDPAGHRFMNWGAQVPFTIC